MGRIWYIQIGEPISWIDTDVRPGRGNILVKTLLARGHEVVWWSSTFYHLKKQYRFESSQTLYPEPRLELHLLHGSPSYRYNISMRRLLNQKSVARAFTAEISSATKPDLILACVPTPEMASIAGRYAVACGVPFVVDVRDPWPDAYLNFIAKPAWKIVSFLLTLERLRLQQTMHAATAITAVSPQYLNWAIRYAARAPKAWDEVIPIGSVLQPPATPHPAGFFSDDGGNPLRFIFAGTFSRSADLETAIKAAAILAKKGRADIRIVMAGQGETFPTIASRARGLQNIELTGWLSQKQLEREFHDAYAGLGLYSPVASQSLPNKVFDYLALGLPQITSLEGDFEKIMQDAYIGKRYIAGDPESLAAQMEWLADHRSERHRMSENSLALFRGNYSPSLIYNRFADKIGHLMESSAAAGKLRDPSILHRSTRGSAKGAPARPKRFWIVQMGELLSGVDGATRDYRFSMLAKELANRGHEVVRWSNTFNHQTKQFRTKESVTLPIAPRLLLRLLHGGPAYRKNISLARVLQQRAVAREFAREAGEWQQPDLVFAGIPVLELAEQALNYGRSRGIPVVADVQDLWPDIYLTVVPPRWRPPLRRLLAHEFRRLSNIVRNATVITAVSQTYFRWALGHAGRTCRPDDGIFPLGITVRQRRPSSAVEQERLRTELGIPEGAMIGLFLGTFGVSYDLETVIRAAAILRERRAQVHIILSGDGEKMPTVRRMAMNLSNVSVTGWVDQSRAALFGDLASVGLCSYTRNALQSIPYKPIEYMAMGLPLLSSLDGELRAIVAAARCGLHYPAGDAAALAEALMWLTAHPGEGAEMGKRGNLLFRARFDAEKIYPALGDLLEELAKSVI